jgi:hypothetical protein
MLLVYSQTRAMGWDEGFHLLAARLIAAGKWPYRDFVFGQVPLGAWWNALVMMSTGYGWRGPHVAAALESAGATWLTADYVWRRTPEPSRLAMSLAAASLVGLNQLTVNYATMSQAYALCMLLGIAAFRSCVASRYFLSGVLAGAAASSSLLMAPLGPVLFVASVRRGGLRFAFGALVGLIPVCWYLALTPHAFLFDVVGFHIYYRAEGWGNSLSHDLEVVSGWLDAGQGMMIVTLAAAGAVWGRANREIRLCAAVAIAECLFLSVAHPTFAQYFSMVVPFAAMLAAVALQRFYEHYPRQWPAATLGCLMLVMLTRTLAQQTDKMSWGDLAKVSQAVRAVLKPSDTLYADEHIYLLTGRMPPSGLEWNGNHKIDMPLAQARPLHVLPQAELDKEVKRGDFSVFESCEEDDVKRLGVEDLYAKKQQIGSCFVFHDLKVH